MLTSEILSYSFIGLTHLLVIGHYVMHEYSESNNSALSLQEAFFELIHELYTHGPLRLIYENEHPELVGRRTRLCCVSHPFLSALKEMTRQELVKEVKNESRQSMFTLTDRGLLMAYFLRARWKAEKNRCFCEDCTTHFERLLSEMKTVGALQLVTKDNCEFPHLQSSKLRICLEDESILDAIAKLENAGLVKLTEDLAFQLTKEGHLTTHLMLSTDSRARAKTSQLN